ncbi:hypothetical protein Slin15195_G092500 [Septoria linicola]|uniref:Rhodopsin domain-containing protein n=1 Tax=Septoria linicola TaxID=215465 RepID=A0A9Q9B421_9PEZI|nr:hypothetical protein Slin15195_G092500 [Septoria linicola]
MALTSIDPSVYASWPTPDYVDPERRTWMPAFLLVGLAAVTVMLSGRFYLRFRKLAGTYGWDDLLIFLGYLFSIGMTVATWVDVVHFGLDRHAWDVRPEWAVGAAKVGWVAQVLFVAATVCTKLSVLLFHRRMIKETVDPRWLWALRAAFAFTSCYGVGVILAYMLTCRPLNALWLAYDPTYTGEYSCASGTNIAVVAGVLSVVSDIIAVLLPCLMLNHYNLNISRKQSIVLNATFCLGLVATGAGIARTVYLWKIQHTADTTWTGHTLFAWSIVETQLAIMCACAPSLRAFFRRYLLDTLKRTCSSVSHYAHGSFHSTDYAGKTTKTNSEGFSELKQLESGVHGIQYPPPVILNEQERELRISQSSPCGSDFAFNETKALPPSPKVTSADQYERYANERLSRHVPSIRERQSRTESILVKMDYWVDQSSVRGQSHDRRNTAAHQADDGFRQIETNARTAS